MLDAGRSPSVETLQVKVAEVAEGRRLLEGDVFAQLLRKGFDRCVLALLEENSDDAQLPDGVVTLC